MRQLLWAFAEVLYCASWVIDSLRWWIERLALPHCDTIRVTFINESNQTLPPCPAPWPERQVVAKKIYKQSFDDNAFKLVATVGADDAVWLDAGPQEPDQESNS